MPRLPRQGSHLLVILFEEVEFLFQAVQVSSQSGDDLVMVWLCPPQSLTVPLHWLAQGGLRLPSAELKLKQDERRSSADMCTSFSLCLAWIIIIFSHCLTSIFFFFFLNHKSLQILQKPLKSVHVNQKIFHMLQHFARSTRTSDPYINKMKKFGICCMLIYCWPW